MRLILKQIIVIALIPVLFSQCKNSKKENKKEDKAVEQTETIIGNFSDQTTLHFDSAAIGDFFNRYPNFTSVKEKIDSFYANRNYSYAWFDKNGLIEQANNLFVKVKTIQEEGLPTSMPYIDTFEVMLNQAGASNTLFTEAELMLTAQYFSYANAVWTGISDTKTKELEWFLPRKKTPYQQLLDSLLAGKNIWDSTPVYAQYDKLKQHLKILKTIQEQGGWQQIILDKKSYKLGDSSNVIGQIRNRLFVGKHLSQNNQSNVYDTEMEKAILQLQKNYGYKPDGVIGANVIKELNVPVEKRIEQIIVNMERARWVPVESVNDYILVNIPEFKLNVFENKEVALSMDVVVGKEQHKTVIFNGDLKYVVFSPYWNVPASIIRNEIMPGIRRNRNYLARHNMEWNGGKIRQKPGPKNSLGLVKFLFPNTHSIYLHDTPSKSLFKEDNRAFSHGCIRLSEPQKLAEYLLRNDTAWNTDKIVVAMNKGVEQFVTLKKPIPVIITYFTAWVDNDGALNFRNDVYKRDSRIAEMLLEKQ